MFPTQKGLCAKTKSPELSTLVTESCCVCVGHLTYLQETTLNKGDNTVWMRYDQDPLDKQSYPQPVSLYTARRPSFSSVRWRGRRIANAGTFLLRKCWALAKHIVDHPWGERRGNTVDRHLPGMEVVKSEHFSFQPWRLCRSS